MLPQPPPETVMTNHYGVEERIEATRTVGTAKFKRIIKEESNSSSSSSIGNNSDDDQEGDAQSPYRYDHDNPKIRHGSLDDAIQALEESLPIRRGISTFYEGKSKSFTCLANMWCSSINDIAKPENAFNRRRRNLLASTLFSNKSKNQLSTVNTHQISKKPKTTTLHFALEREDIDIQKSNLSSMRSFSMVNLHRCRSRLVDSA